jgi:predicted short-subunit dehydrogenase-like oxidoreductase (DUF2520 family)
VPVDVSGVTIVLVGPGRAGRAFARSWTRAGGSIVLVARRPRALQRFAREIGAHDVRSLGDRRRLGGDALVLAVPDDSISRLAARIAPRVGCRFAFHFSGALSSGELGRLSSVGARVASVHPLRAFTGSADESWSAAYVAIEGNPSAVRFASAICRRLGAHPHPIDAAKKPLYHAAATLAAGGAGSLLSIAARLWSEAGLNEEEGREALAGLAASAVDSVRRLPFGRALTGPVARRDVATVALHERALAGRPDVARLYAMLAEETLRRTRGRGAEREIARLLEGRRGRRARTAPGGARSPRKKPPEG